MHYIHIHHIDSSDLDKFPLLKYLKEPVSEVGDLYNRYPNGGERGWFAYVESSSTFFYWDRFVGDWRPIKAGSDGVIEVDPTVADWAKKGASTAGVLQQLGGQPLLRSGINIATINGKSLLNGGNIVIDGGTGGYTHPATHPASMIVQDSTHRFVTDAQIAQWNSAQTGGIDTTGWAVGSFAQWNGSTFVGAVIGGDGATGDPYVLPVGLTALNELTGNGFVYKTGEATWGLIDDVFTITRNEDGTVKSVQVNADLFSTGEVTAYYSQESGGTEPGDEPVGVSRFMDLTDVDPTSITTGKFLQWNGSKIVGADVNAGGGGIVTETDPLFSSHIISSLVAGTGFLKRTTSGWSWDATDYEPRNTSIQSHLANSDIHVSAIDKSHWNTAYNHVSSTSNPHNVTKTQVGLGNVTNESKTTMFTNPKFTGTAESDTFKTGLWTITGGTSLSVAYNGSTVVTILNNGAIISKNEVTAYG
jgi:hypothetical protein